MNLQTIAEHTVDMDLLPKNASVLDAGCRGFEFTNYFKSKGCYVLSIDADELPEINKYVRCALTDYDGWCDLIKYTDPQATQINKDSGGSEDGVRCFTLANLMDDFNVQFFDLIKLDIESSEYEVIMSMDKPYATQITVEMHTHCGQTEEQVTEMVNKLHSLGYKTIQHEKTSRHGLPKNYWDSLFVL